MSKTCNQSWATLLCALGIGIFFGHTALSAEGKLVATIAHWSVVSHVNSMNDKKSCIAKYKNDPQIQLGADSLYISLQGRGGVKGYQVRLNDEKPDKLHLASEIERKASVVEFRGKAFDRLVTAKRLRVEVITILDTLREYDIDLGAYAELRKVFSSNGCN